MVGQVEDLDLEVYVNHTSAIPQLENNEELQYLQEGVGADLLHYSCAVVMDLPQVSQVEYVDFEVYRDHTRAITMLQKYEELQYLQEGEGANLLHYRGAAIVNLPGVGQVEDEDVKVQ